MCCCKYVKTEPANEVQSSSSPELRVEGPSKLKSQAWIQQRLNQLNMAISAFRILVGPPSVAPPLPWPMNLRASRREHPERPGTIRTSSSFESWTLCGLVAWLPIWSFPRSCWSPGWNNHTSPEPKPRTAKGLSPVRTCKRYLGRQQSRHGWFLS